MPLTKTGRSPGTTVSTASIALAGEAMTLPDRASVRGRPVAGSPHDGMSEGPAVQAHSTGSLE
jgi:hypothetical protein